MYERVTQRQRVLFLLAYHFPTILAVDRTVYDEQ